MTWETDWELGLGPEPPEPCQYCSVMDGALKECDHSCDSLTAERWTELNKAAECPPRTEGAKPHCPDCSGIVGETGIVW